MIFSFAKAYAAFHPQKFFCQRIREKPKARLLNFIAFNYDTLISREPYFRPESFMNSCLRFVKQKCFKPAVTVRGDT